MEKLELNERYYREVTVNSEILGKWVYLVRIKKYDSKGNLIYEGLENREIWREYNSHGDKIFEKRDDGSEVTWQRKYDNNGKCIYKEDSDGIETWAEYDSKGNLIHRC